MIVITAESIAIMNLKLDFFARFIWPADAAHCACCTTENGFKKIPVIELKAFRQAWVFGKPDVSFFPARILCPSAEWVSE